MCYTNNAIVFSQSESSILIIGVIVKVIIRVNRFLKESNNSYENNNEKRKKSLVYCGNQNVNPLCSHNQQLVLAKYFFRIEF